MLRHLMMDNRSVRRFDESVRISDDTLLRLVELVRYTPSGRNAQPLKYRLVNSVEECAILFPHLKWAGYFHDWDGPAEGERPAAYLIQCLDTHYGADCLCDDGLQLEAITLALHTMDLGGCIIKAFNTEGVRRALDIDERYVPRYVLAVGRPAEKVVIEDMTEDEDDDFKYYRTADGKHHVPKRPLSSLII
ncbi:MAG: nitroreductase family protein [Muribaculaceae bacterium]|nr:nitroreductase family protein [Muribaculaceae bacterium]